MQGRNSAVEGPETILKPLSIHPSVSAAYSGVGSWGQQTQPADPHFPLNHNIDQLILGDPEASTGQPGDVIPPVYPLSSQLDVPGKPLKGGVQEASELDARSTSADSLRRDGVAARL